MNTIPISSDPKALDPNIEHAHNVNKTSPQVISVFDVVLGPFKWLSQWEALKKHEEINDQDGATANKFALVQIPTSAIYTLGNLATKIVEVGSVFNWFTDTSFILPLSQAVAGLGIILCISDIAMETLGLRRTLRFEARFIDAPQPTFKNHQTPGQKDVPNLINWAKKAEKQSEVLLEKLGKNQNPQLERKLEGIKDKAHSLQSSIEDLEISPLDMEVNNLQKAIFEYNQEVLRQVVEEAKAEEAADKLNTLHRVLGVNFTSTVAENIANAPEISTAINKKTLELMETQILKRKIAHALGIAGSVILLAGLIAVTTACPVIAVSALIALGTALGFARFIFWATYAESNGWEKEFHKWMNGTVAEIKETFTGIKNNVLTPIGENLLEGLKNFESPIVDPIAALPRIAAS